MKIRIKSNTIRLRLSQVEVSALVSAAEVWDSCHFASSTLKYGISPIDSEIMNADFDQAKIHITIPKSWLENWDKDNRVGFDYQLTNGTYLLVEKDFKCLVDREHEDESNLYPNPKSEES